MPSCLSIVLVPTLLLAGAGSLESQEPPDSAWPDGKLAAVSLSFDDTRDSQIDTGMPLLERLGTKATFYVMPGRVESRLAEWRQLAEAGHEIGNHSMRHPCTGNFAWSRDAALEDYGLEAMRSELAEANRLLRQMLGSEPATFAYPCGQSFVGRGSGTRSYVPVVAELFIAGRGWLDETPNSPLFLDLAQVSGMSMDAKDAAEVWSVVENARESGAWLVLAGHDFGQSGPQTTRVSMLEQLVPRLKAPESGIWLATVEEVARYIARRRAHSARAGN